MGASAAGRRERTPDRSFPRCCRGGDLGGATGAARPVRVRPAVPRRRGGVRARHLRATRCWHGWTGICRLAALASRRPVGRVYGGDYAASGDFPPPGDLQAGLQFVSTVVNGIYDARDHVQATAANCPNTRIVLGGYSQGAALAGFVTSADIPEEVPAEYVQYVPKSMPPEVANHVAAVALFGKPSDQFLSGYGVPPMRIGPLYAPKTIELCAPGDDVCSGAAGAQPGFAHITYGMNGMTNEAAAFVANRL